MLVCRLNSFVEKGEKGENADLFVQNILPFYTKHNIYLLTLEGRIGEKGENLTFLNSPLSPQFSPLE